MILFDEVTGIPGNTQTTVFSFTNTDNTRYLRILGVEGTYYGLWEVYINMTEVLSRRTTAAEMSLEVEMFSNVILVGEIIDIKVTHCDNDLQDFSANIIITDTPDEDITIININMNVPLVGTMKTTGDFIGGLTTSNNFVGSFSDSQNFVGTLADSSDLKGVLETEKDLNGVLTCI